MQLTGTDSQFNAAQHPGRPESAFEPGSMQRDGLWNRPRGRHGANILTSACYSVDLEKIQQFGQAEEEPDFIARVSQRHPLTALLGAALDQHQSPKSSRIQPPGLLEVQHQPTLPFWQLLKQPYRRLAEFGTRFEPQGHWGPEHAFAGGFWLHRLARGHMALTV